MKGIQVVIENPEDRFSTDIGGVVVDLGSAVGVQASGGQCQLSVIDLRPVPGRTLRLNGYSSKQSTSDGSLGSFSSDTGGWGMERELAFSGAVVSKGR